VSFPVQVKLLNIKLRIATYLQVYIQAEKCDWHFGKLQQYCKSAICHHIRLLADNRSFYSLFKYFGLSTFKNARPKDGWSGPLAKPLHTMRVNKVKVSKSTTIAKDLQE
jgi:hypothetical protein